MRAGTAQPISPIALRQAFGVFPSGVVAVLGTVGGAVTGLAVSAFASVSLAPPLVAVFVRNDSKTWPELRAASRLGISVLLDGQGELARQLAGPVDRRLRGVPLVGAHEPFLADAAARFDVEVDRETAAGDHIMVLLRVLEAEIVDGACPLVFHRSEFATLR